MSPANWIRFGPVRRAELFMEWPKFLRRRKENISPENQAILDLMGDLQRAENNLVIVQQESEKPSGFSNDYQHDADDIRIQEIQKGILGISERIMHLCKENNLDPARFLKPEHIQSLENAHKKENGKIAA